MFHCLYCNVDCHSVAKQRLGNKPQQQGDCFLWGLCHNRSNAIVEAVFPVGSVERSYLKNKWHYSLVASSEWQSSVKGSYEKIVAAEARKQSELGLGVQKNKKSACEDLVCD
jgi:hypothetical protein